MYCKCQGTSNKKKINMKCFGCILLCVSFFYFIVVALSSLLGYLSVCRVSFFFRSLYFFIPFTLLLSLPINVRFLSMDFTLFCLLKERIWTFLVCRQSREEMDVDDSHLFYCFLRSLFHFVRIYLFPLYSVVVRWNLIQVDSLHLSFSFLLMPHVLLFTIVMVNFIVNSFRAYSRAHSRDCVHYGLECVTQFSVGSYIKGSSERSERV